MNEEVQHQLTQRYQPKSYQEQKLENEYIRKFHTLREYMNGKYSLNDVYEQIENKTCGLSRAMREFVMFNKEQDEGEVLDKLLQHKK